MKWSTWLKTIHYLACVTFEKRFPRRRGTPRSTPVLQTRLPKPIHGTVGRGGGPWWGGAAWRHAGGCEVECDTGVKTTCHSRDCSDRPVSTAGAKSKTEVAFHYVRSLAWLAQRLGWGWGRGRRRGGDGSRSLWRCQQVRTAPAPDWRNKHVIQVVRLSPRCSVEKKLSIKRSSLPFLSLSLRRLLFVSRARRPDTRIPVSCMALSLRYDFKSTLRGV